MSGSYYPRVDISELIGKGHPTRSTVCQAKEREPSWIELIPSYWWCCECCRVRGSLNSNLEAGKEDGAGEAALRAIYKGVGG